MLKPSFILNNPRIFLLFQKLIGAHRIKILLIENINFKSNSKILDIGCGFGNLLDHLLDDIQYLGVDISKDYINYAKNKYAGRGKFICGDITKLTLKKEKFDTVIISSLLHHLSDKDVEKIFKSLQPLLKPGSKIISADSVYIKKQSFFAKLVADHDRGKHVRTTKEYLRLANKYFPRTKFKIISNLLNIPVDLIFMQMNK